MARLDARWLNFWERSQAWYSFWQDGPSGTAAISGTATFAQAAATWAAAAGETFTATATWSQAAASWSATGSEAFTGIATWAQAAGAWSGTAAETFAATATFDQAAATWTAATDTPVIEQPIRHGPPLGAAIVTGPARRRVVRLPQPVILAGAFSQPASRWAAAVLNDDTLIREDEEYLLLEAA